MFDASGALTVVNSTMETDGGVVWKEAVHGNALSCETPRWVAFVRPLLSWV